MSLQTVEHARKNILKLIIKEFLFENVDRIQVAPN